MRRPLRYFLGYPLLQFLNFGRGKLYKVFPCGMPYTLMACYAFDNQAAVGVNPHRTEQVLLASLPASYPPSYGWARVPAKQGISPAAESS